MTPLSECYSNSSKAETLPAKQSIRRRSPFGPHLHADDPPGRGSLAYRVPLSARLSSPGSAALTTTPSHAGRSEGCSARLCAVPPCETGGLVGSEHSTLPAASRALGVPLWYPDGWDHAGDGLGRRRRAWDWFWGRWSPIRHVVGGRGQSERRLKPSSCVPRMQWRRP